VVTPPSQQTMDRISEVVAAAAGIIPTRGDRLVVEALPFETTKDEPPDSLREQPPRQESPVTVTQRVTIVALIGLAVALGFAMRSRRKLELKVADEAPPLALPAAEVQKSAPKLAAPATQFAKQLESQNLKEQEHQKQLEAAGAALKSLVEGAVEMSQSNSELCAGVLRGWLNEKAEKVEMASK